MASPSWTWLSAACSCTAVGQQQRSQAAPHLFPEAGKHQNRLVLLPHVEGAAAWDAYPLQALDICAVHIHIGYGDGIVSSLIHAWAASPNLALAQPPHLSWLAPVCGHPRFCARRCPAGRWRAGPGSAASGASVRSEALDETLSDDAEMHSCRNRQLPLCMLSPTEQHVHAASHDRQSRTHRGALKQRYDAAQAGQLLAISMLLKRSGASMKLLTAPPLLPRVMLPNWCFPGSPMKSERRGLRPCWLCLPRWPV